MLALYRRRRRSVATDVIASSSSLKSLVFVCLRRRVVVRVRDASCSFGARCVLSRQCADTYVTIISRHRVSCSKTVFPYYFFCFVRVVHRPTLVRKLREFPIFALFRQNAPGSVTNKRP